MGRPWLSHWPKRPHLQANAMGTRFENAAYHFHSRLGSDWWQTMPAAGQPRRSLPHAGRALWIASPRQTRRT